MHCPQRPSPLVLTVSCRLIQTLDGVSNETERTGLAARVVSVGSVGRPMVGLAGAAAVAGWLFRGFGVCRFGAEDGRNPRSRVRTDGESDGLRDEHRDDDSPFDATGVKAARRSLSLLALRKGAPDQRLLAIRVAHTKGSDTPVTTLPLKLWHV
jgi:hypothetical protein